MKYIHIYNYHWPRIFILFNINSAILPKLAKYVVPFFNCLQLKAKCLLFTVEFSLKNLCATCNCFLLSTNYFLLSSAFLQYFRLINLIMVFLEQVLDLPILLQSSTSLYSTLTSISGRIDLISGMPEINKYSSYCIAQGHHEKVW